MTNLNLDDIFGDLEDDFATVAVKKTVAREKFPCQQCQGTGKWNARRANKHGDDHCFACKGKGYFLTSIHDRAKARNARVARKISKADAAQEQNTAAADGILLEWIKSNSDWNSFAASLLEQHGNGRAWSEKQVAAALSMMAKCQAKREAAAAEREAKSVDVDLSPIGDMFTTALESGYKKPMYRAEGIRLKPGKNGALYVLSDTRTEAGHFGEQPMYEGKIVDGKFFAGRNAATDTATALLEIAKAPRDAAVRYGQRTGRCSCCGRELTKHSSIDAGIGPICAEKWGL